MTPHSGGNSGIDKTFRLPASSEAIAMRIRGKPKSQNQEFQSTSRRIMDPQTHEESWGHHRLSFSSYASQVISLLPIGVLCRSAEVRLVVPSGPLAGGTWPVPPVRSTATLTPAGPQAPCAPAMLQSVTLFEDSLRSASVRIS